KLRRDPRVSLLERTNARALDPARLPFRPDLAVCDVSFISLERVLPALVAAVGPGGRPIVMLVKPQVEVGRGAVGKGGVVRDQDQRRRAVERVGEAAMLLGCEVVGVVESPITGPKGNVEYLLYLRTGGRERVDSAGGLESPEGEGTA